MSVAKRVSEEMEVSSAMLGDTEDKLTISSPQCELGGEVGYVIRFEDCTSDKTVIKCESSLRCSSATVADLGPVYRHDRRSAVARVAQRG